MSEPLTTCVCALATGVLWWRWLHNGRTRAPETPLRLSPRWSWLVVLVAATLGWLISIAAVESVALPALVFSTGAYVLVWTDIAQYWLPWPIMRVWAPATIATGIATMACVSLADAGRVLLASVVIFAIFIALALLPKGLGTGDAYLAAACAALLACRSWHHVLAGMCLAIMINAVWIVAETLLARLRHRPHLTKVPLAPALVAATMLAVLGLPAS